MCLTLKSCLTVPRRKVVTSCADLPKVTYLTVRSKCVTFDHLNGWLLCYIIASIPVFAFWSAGLAGWFFNYPLVLFGGILLVLLTPLALLLIGVPAAPLFNVAALWTGATLLVGRVTWGWMHADEDRLTFEALAILTGSGGFAVAWALVWTLFLTRSEHVSRTFG